MISAKTAKVGAIASAPDSRSSPSCATARLELRADVTETDLMRLAPGQKAEVALTDGAETLHGTIRPALADGRCADPLGIAYISLPEPDRARVGMYPGHDHGGAEDGAEPAADGRDPQGRWQLCPQGGGWRDQAGACPDGHSGWRQRRSRLRLAAGDQVVSKAGAYVRDGDKINPVIAAPAETN